MFQSLWKNFCRSITKCLEFLENGIHLQHTIRRKSATENMGMEHGFGKTITELAESAGRKPDTLYRKFRGAFPAEKWSVSSIPTGTQIREVLGDAPAPAKSRAPRKAKGVKVAPVVDAPGTEGQSATEEKPAKTTWGWQEYILCALLIAPTVASVRNMYNVTYNLSEHATDAALLTVVLSVSALGFVVAGVRRRYGIALAVLLIAFESFCNLTRVYGGLMGVGKSGNPTRFLGLVTDIFGSGSHYTAIVLGAAVALFLACVQYAAVFELNRK